MNAGPDNEEVEAKADSANTDSPYTQFSYLRSISREVKDWSGSWGGIEGWAIRLGDLYAEAVERDLVSDWVNTVWEHARLGRQYLGRMQHMEGRLPADMQKIRELWRLSMEVLDILYRGLGILETRARIIDSDIEHPAFNLLAQVGSPVDDVDESPVMLS